MSEAGGYVTRGRAEELFRRMDELEELLEQRVRELGGRIDQALELELALAKARIGAELSIVREHGKESGGATTN